MSENDIKKGLAALEKVVKKLDDENLTITLSYSKGKYFVSVSTHTSEKLQFDHGGYQRTCMLLDEDLKKSNEILISDLTNIYKGLLKEVEEDAS